VDSNPDRYRGPIKAIDIGAVLQTHPSEEARSLGRKTLAEASRGGQFVSNTVLSGVLALKWWPIVGAQPARMARLGLMRTVWSTRV
jgi:hypothetical protein